MDKSNDFFLVLYDKNNEWLFSALWKVYSENAKKTLELFNTAGYGSSQKAFSAINNRLSVSLGMSINFGHKINIRGEDTLRIYALLLKISDLWFVVENTHKVFCKNKLDLQSELIQKHPQKRFLIFNDSINQAPLFVPIAEIFIRFLEKAEAKSDKLELLKKTINEISRELKGELKAEIDKWLQETFPKVESTQILALAYGIRNFYSHNGAVAKIGHDKNSFTRKFLEMVHDALILYAIYLANLYAEILIMKARPRV